MSGKLSRAEIVYLLSKMYSGENACDLVIACPIYIFWEEMAEAFPAAKIIFYHREIESWLKSAIKQHNSLAEIRKYPDWVYPIFYYFFSPKNYICNRYFDKCAELIFLGKFNGWFTWSHGRDRAKPIFLRKTYERHTSHVLQQIKIRGWENRFCQLENKDFAWIKFYRIIFDREISDTDLATLGDFPHVNKNAAFAKDVISKEAPLSKILKSDIKYYCKIYCCAVFLFVLILYKVADTYRK